MKNSNNISVIKIGGSTLGEGDSTFEDIVTLFKKGWKIILVHGGGKEISNWINKQGIEPQFLDGLRVTDKKTLDVALAVLSGKINSEIVSEGIAISYNHQSIVIAMGEELIRFKINLNIGSESGVAWGSELTEEYVVFNSAYTT